jgi:hypothetical protein
MDLLTRCYLYGSVGERMSARLVDDIRREMWTDNEHSAG